MYDQTGRKLAEGQLVHVLVNGMLVAKIVEIMEMPIQIPGQGLQPPQVVLQVIIPMTVPRQVAEVYVVRESDVPAKTEIVQ